MKGISRFVYKGPATAQTVFSCQTNTAAPRCYGPTQIRAAYDITPLLNSGITGRGRTIVIVDAYQSPNIRNDLHVFDQNFGLRDPQLNIIAPQGLTPYSATDPIQQSWSGEISLDVEWSHAVAPDATIDLVLAKSSYDVDILAATKFAVDANLGDVLSQSFGEAEQCFGVGQGTPVTLQQQHAVFREATFKGITLFASSGDSGAAQPSCDGTSYVKSASTPASDPLVTAVGATQLDANARTGAYLSEIALNEPAGQFTPGTFASGGGFSTVYLRPAYQNGVLGPIPVRGVPDVAYSGAIDGGVLVAFSPDGTNASQAFYIFGGTSVGSPQWAGITALADQLAGRRLGFLNGGLYLLAQSTAYRQDYRDITFGNNTFQGTDSSGNPVQITGYATRQGWDAVTGWGSPRVASLVPDLINSVRAAGASAIP